MPQNNSKIEGKSGITEERTEEYGKKILDIIQYVYSQKEEKKRFRKWIEGYVAGFLQGRLSEEQSEKFSKIFDQGHLKLFEKIIAGATLNLSQKRGYRVERGEGDNYLQVSNPDNGSRFGNEKKIKEGAEIIVFNKEYFTFTPSSVDPHGILAEAIKFYSALSSAYTRLQDIAKENQWSINMKFKDDLIGLLNDLDGAVFYVSNDEAGKITRQIVEEEMGRAKISTNRSGRAETGFDIKFLLDGESSSHRQLIAKAVAKTIDDDYWGARKIASFTPKELGESIRRRADQAGKLTPEQLVEAAA